MLYVDDNTVTIKVSATDDLSDTSKLKVAFINENELIVDENSGITTSSGTINWLDYEANKEWTSSEGDGYKIVYVLFKDEAGNQSVYLAQ